MERQREKPKEVPKEEKEKIDRELEELRIELARLKELKKVQELQRIQEEDISTEEELSEPTDENIENRLNKIEDFLTSNLGQVDNKAYKQNAEEIERELQLIETEIIGEKAVVAKEVS